MHYKNGREAKIGDPVIGKVYNQAGPVAGTLVSLTLGSDNCSAQVEWIGVEKVEAGAPLLQRKPPPNAVMMEFTRMRGDEQHGAGGTPVRLMLCRDYTHAANLLHVADVLAALPATVPDTSKPAPPSTDNEPTKP
ncbi:MAG: hypothetical protein ACYDD4_14850 [Acidimicrobiales bacterium]